MVKCVVSRCPHRRRRRSVQEVCDPRRKKFFSLPVDPARVQAWMTALGETKTLDSAVHHLICEDHFLPQDISSKGILSDALPVMLARPDEPDAANSSSSTDVSEEEDPREEDGESCGDERNDSPSVPEPCVREPSEPSLHVPEPPTLTASAPACHQLSAMNPPKQHPEVQRMSEIKPTVIRNVVRRDCRGGRQDTALEKRVKHYKHLLMNAPDRKLDIRAVCADMQIKRVRFGEINNILEGIGLVGRLSTHCVRWKGRSYYAEALAQQKFQKEMENLDVVEQTLDSLIRSCSQQLFDATNDGANAALAYLTVEDIRALDVFQEQTVMVVKAPEETRLEVPAPTEHHIQVRLRAENRPIAVLTCGVAYDGVAGEENGFLSLQESQIKTSELQRDAVNRSLPAPQTDVSMPDGNVYGGKTIKQEFLGLQIDECAASR